MRRDIWLSKIKFIYTLSIYTNSVSCLTLHNFISIKTATCLILSRTEEKIIHIIHLHRYNSFFFNLWKIFRCLLVEMKHQYSVSVSRLILSTAQFFFLKIKHPPHVSTKKIFFPSICTKVTRHLLSYDHVGCMWRHWKVEKYVEKCNISSYFRNSTSFFYVTLTS